MSDVYRDTLPELELTLDISTGLRVRYRLTARELVAESEGKATGTKAITLADVTRVELATLGGTTICTVSTTTTKIAVSSGMEPMAKGSEREIAFYGLLEALNERVAQASPSAAFVAGSWTVVGGFIVITAIGVALVAWMSQTSLRETWKFTVALVAAAFACLVAVPIAIVRGRPRPYDPRKIPRVYDPLHGRG